MVYERRLAVVVVAVLLQKWLCDFGDVCSCSVLYAYKALDGEGFIMQCASPHERTLYEDSVAFAHSTRWFRHDGQNKTELPGINSSIVKVGNSLWFSKISEEHSGNYSCYTGDAKRKLTVGGSIDELHFLVDIVQRNETACPEEVESNVTLILGEGAEIACLDVRCYNFAPKGVISWYKNARKKPEQVKSLLFLKSVNTRHNANYTCDLSYEDGLNWTMRRTVRVRAIPPDTKEAPHILYPLTNQTEEAELGKPHNLTCKAQFGFERNLNGSVTWWVKYQDSGSMEPLQMSPPTYDSGFHGPGEQDFSVWEYTESRQAYLHQVNQRQLAATFICRAQNSIGCASASITLQRKPEVNGNQRAASLLKQSIDLAQKQRNTVLWTGSAEKVAGLLLVILGPVVTLMFVSGISLLVRIYRLEINLLYRTYLPLEETESEGKEYDAFVSCISGPWSEKEDGRLTGETLGMHHLPDVLEKQFGYRLCLLQRDVVPGGVYAEDVVWSVQRSRRVICVLSSCYLQSSCLFELEASLEALQRDRGLRLILVWSGPVPPGYAALPLPPTVRRALRVLPALHWSPSQARPSQSPFWKALKKAMPISPIPCPSQSELSLALRVGRLPETPEA